MTLLKNQQVVSPQRGMPVETMDDSHRIEAITGETIQLQFWNSGTLTNDAGQAAGVLVVGKLAQGTVLNDLTDALATSKSTSLSFTSTALTNEVALPTGYDAHDDSTSEGRASAITTGFSNGDYCVDYAHGIIYGVKASTQSTLTSGAYSIPVRGGSSSVALGSVAVSDVVPGVGATNLGKAEDAAHTTGDVGVMGLTVRQDTPAALSDTDGDYQPSISNAFGAVWTAPLGNVDHDDADAGNPIKTGGKAQDPTALPAAVAADDRTDHMTDLYGRPVMYLGTALDPTNDIVGTTPRDVSNINTSAYATSLVVKASAGKCFDIRGYNSLASAQFVQVHDAASLPADTAVPEEVVSVPASSNFSITFPEGKTFSTGIVVCNSSTGPTKTIGAADLWISADLE